MPWPAWAVRSRNIITRLGQRSMSSGLRFAPMVQMADNQIYKYCITESQRLREDCNLHAQANLR